MASPEDIRELRPEDIRELKIEVLKLREQVTFLTSAMVPVLGALNDIRQIAVKVAAQPTLLLSQDDRQEIQKAVQESIDNIGELIRKVEHLLNMARGSSG